MGRRSRLLRVQTGEPRRSSELARAACTRVWPSLRVGMDRHPDAKRQCLGRMGAWWLVICLLSSSDASIARAEDEAQPPPAPARVEEQKSFHGVPVFIVRPRDLSPGTRLVLLFHGFGPPQSPQALSRALPLEKLAAVL